MPARGHALLSSHYLLENEERGGVSVLLLFFIDAFISRFKECLNIKCLEIRKKKKFKRQVLSINEEKHALIVHSGSMFEVHYQLEEFTRERALSCRDREAVHQIY